MKKKINIGLILIVVSLWGVIGYRIIKNYFFEQPQENTYSYDYENISHIITKRDSFQLTSLKHDPFLDQKINLTEERKKYKASKKINEQILKSKAVVTPGWPSIEYYGFIKPNNSPEIYVIKLDNNIVRLKKGETKNEITIRKVFKDSIALSYQGTEKIFFVKKH